MNITWASVAWLFWSLLMLVSIGGMVLAIARRGARGVPVSATLLLGGLLMFGLVSGVTGLYEQEDYARSRSFWISIALGGVGAGLFGVSLRRILSHNL